MKGRRGEREEGRKGEKRCKFILSDKANLEMTSSAYSNISPSPPLPFSPSF
jgi:hypothetical protein